MDISSYWQSIKKQSKELTGVEKINAGVFHKSGIGGSLEKYIKAVDSGKEKDIAKTAKVALEKSEKYLNGIHKKEVATGKKAMTKAQLKSAGIVSDALDKIIAQLRKVVAGDVEAGSFDRDGGDDVYESTMGKAEAHIDLRKKVARDAKGYVTQYKNLATPVAKLLKLGEKCTKDAENTQARSEVSENMTAVVNAERVVSEIEKILDKIEKHYEKNILNGKSDFMVCRKDFKMNDLPKQFLADYKKRHNAAWKPVAAAGDELNKIRNTLKADLETARELADKAESFSLTKSSFSKTISKLEAIAKQAVSLERSAKTAIDRVQSGARAMGDALKADAEVQEKVLALREPEAAKRVAQFGDHAKSARKLKNRVESLTKDAEDDGVLKAGQAALEPLLRIENLVPTLRSEYQAFSKAVNTLKSALGKRPASSSAN